MSDTRNCCNNETAQVTINVGVLVLPTQTTTVGAGATETKTKTVSDGATATVTAKCTSSPNDSANTSANCPKDLTAVVGGAVGGVLGAALLASTVTIALLLRRRQGPAPQYQQVVQYSAAPGQMNPGMGAGPPPQELPSSTSFYEMQVNQVRLMPGPRAPPPGCEDCD